jgi:AraC-like DNA-binding protein
MTDHDGVYREHGVPQRVACFVEAVWTVSSRGLLNASSMLILPDGCVDMIFDFRPDVITGNTASCFRSYVVGAMTKPLFVGRTSDAETIGIRLRAGCAGSLVGLPLGEITDSTVDAVETTALWRRIASRISEASPGARVDVLLASLEGIEVGVESEVTLALAAIRAITNAAHPLKIDTLAVQFGVSGRTLQRIFHKHVGLSPKQFARIARFRRALKLMKRYPDIELGRIGITAGYYDQSHFIREFRLLSGFTPDAVRNA